MPIPPCRSRPSALQLLQDPLTQQRTARFATGLEYASLPILLVLPGQASGMGAALLKGGWVRGRAGGRVVLVSPGAAEAGRCARQAYSRFWCSGFDCHARRRHPAGAPVACAAGGAPAGQVCHATLSFIQVALIVVVPTLLAVYCWERPRRPVLAVHPLLAAQTAHPQARSPADGGNISSSGVTTAEAPPPPTVSSSGPGRQQCAYTRMRSRVERIASVANWALHAVLYSPAGLDSRLVACWWLLAVSWWVCKRLAGLY